MYLTGRHSLFYRSEKRIKYTSFDSICKKSSCCFRGADELRQRDGISSEIHNVVSDENTFDGDILCEDLDRLDNYLLAGGIERINRWKHPWVMPYDNAMKKIYHVLISFVSRSLTGLCRFALSGKSQIQLCARL